MDYLPMAANCALDESGMRRQVARYRRAGQSARLVERSARMLVVDFDRRLEAELVTEAIAVERECCPFLAIDWQADRGRLTIAVSGPEHAPALEAIAFALAPESTSS